MDSKYLIVGLGNPGKKYSLTRHNAGFMVLDLVAKKYKIDYQKVCRNYWQASFSHSYARIFLIKPDTFMNLSGLAVAEIVYVNSIDLSKLLVICDDINLPFGTIRIRPKGSDGGQKGLRSIIHHLESDCFPRLRIGIGNHFEDAANYVLSRFKKSEVINLRPVLNNAVDAVECFIENEIEKTMSRFNKNYLEEAE